MGAYVAIKISDELGVKAVVFNNASSLLDDRTGKNEIVIHYTTNDIFKGKVDVLSVSSTLRDDYRTIKVKQKDGATIHSIDNFT